jgi:hypothetical protein
VPAAAGSPALPAPASLPLASSPPRPPALRPPAAVPRPSWPQAPHARLLRPRRRRLRKGAAAGWARGGAAARRGRLGRAVGARPRRDAPDAAAAAALAAGPGGGALRRSSRRHRRRLRGRGRVTLALDRGRLGSRSRRLGRRSRRRGRRRLRRGRRRRRRGRASRATRRARRSPVGRGPPTAGGGRRRGARGGAGGGGRAAGGWRQAGVELGDILERPQLVANRARVERESVDGARVLQRPNRVAHDAAAATECRCGGPPHGGPCRASAPLSPGTTRRHAARRAGRAAPRSAAVRGGCTAPRRSAAGDHPWANLWPTPPLALEARRFTPVLACLRCHPCT